MLINAIDAINGHDFAMLFDINNISSTWRCFTKTSLTSPSVPTLEL